MKRTLLIITVLTATICSCATLSAMQLQYEDEIKRSIQQCLARWSRLDTSDDIMRKIKSIRCSNNLLKLAIKYHSPHLALLAFDKDADPNCDTRPSEELKPIYTQCLSIPHDAETTSLENWQYEIIKILLSQPQFDKVAATEELLSWALPRFDINLMQILRDSGIDPQTSSPKLMQYLHQFVKNSPQTPLQQIILDTHTCTAIQYLTFYEKLCLNLEPQSWPRFTGIQQVPNKKFQELKGFLLDWIAETDAASTEEEEFEGEAGEETTGEEAEEELEEEGEAGPQ